MTSDSEEPARKRKRKTFKRPPGLVLGMSRRDPIKPFNPVFLAHTKTKNIDRAPLKSVDQNLINQITPFKMPSFLRPLGTRAGARPGTTLGMRKSRNPRIHALHDPDAPDAIVLYDPPVKVSEQDKLQYCLLNPGKKANFEVQVVVDPILAHVLRPHQVEGLKFLFDCTTGFKSPNAFGCIMADEMGLGKTLQCISLLWTLLRQSPVPGKPSIDKAIIACPSSLVKNWGNELKKWLGDKVRPYSCDNKGSKEDTTKDIQQFVSAKGRAIIYPVLIVSYETLRIYTPILKNTEIGLILCDEGHRLKNRESLTYTALNSLNSKRRIILSGTPIQNDLTEYFSLLSFVIPDVLGSVAEFRRQYENPILRGRDADATDKDKQLSEEKLRELLGTANKFIIRRTAELLTKYLPVKYEYVVFCRMTGMQEQLYHYFAKKEMSRLDKQEVVGEKGGQSSLKAITNLKKIVNHPALLGKDLVPAKLLPDDFNFNECQAEYSGKLCLLEQMIWQMRSETKDKIVIISNYTQTLDLIEKMCRLRKWGLCRLDGTMTINKRQKLVDKFNDQEQPEFVFLLSSKAGGCGINLVGANRLILTDPDWNPATDAQALARVWRDGQKKMCYIYRFITTGTIEEKIFQRQAHKQSLSSCVVDEEQDVERHFSLDSLRKLFKYNPETLCDTHDAFKCKRCKDGKQMIKPNSGVVNAGATAADTSTWNHFSFQETDKIFDHILREQSQNTQIVTFCFENKSHDA